MISSAVLVETKGFRSAFHALIRAPMPASISVTMRCAGRRSSRLAGSACYRSTMSIQPELAARSAGGGEGG
jgi:hypothetical protein